MCGLKKTKFAHKGFLKTLKAVPTPTVILCYILDFWKLFLSTVQIFRNRAKA